MKRKILVTGGAGYIGSHTIIELLNNGFDVVAADNYSNSTPQTYERIFQITQQRIAFEEIDLSNLQATQRFFQKHSEISGIIHFAALKSVPESVEDPLHYYGNNLNSLLNVLQCAVQFNIPNFIFSSSCSVYGNVAELPVNESTATGEIASPYAFTKLAGERILQDFIVKYKDYRGIALRYFNPVGAHISGKLGELPTNRPNNLVPLITQVAIGKLPMLRVFGKDYDTRDGTCIRDYIHVSDIAEAHVLALKHLFDNGADKARYSLFNLGSGTGTSVLEAIKAFEKAAGVQLKFEITERRPGDVSAIYSDSTLAKNTLGWIPKYTIDEMMASAWKWELELANHGDKIRL